MFARSISYSVLLFLVVTFPASYAQKNEDISSDKAAEYFQSGDWEKAIVAYQNITEEQPANSIAWFRLGYALHATGEYEQAIDAYTKVEELSSTVPPVVLYNLGCAYALNGEKENALTELRRSADGGFRQISQIESDADLNSLRGEERFEEIVSSIRANAFPCSVSEGHRQFDFWIGEWDVYGPNGQRVGKNNVRLILGECVIEENWSGVGGIEGKSFNTYNSSTGKWQQRWVDAVGSVLELEGSFEEGSMRLAGETKAQNGQRTLHRLTFTPNEDGTVRQLWEQSTDEGTTWSVAFDGLYKKSDESSGS